jgi:hypothetical protein
MGSRLLRQPSETTHAIVSNARAAMLAPWERLPKHRLTRWVKSQARVRLDRGAGSALGLGRNLQAGRAPHCSHSPVGMWSPRRVLIAVPASSLLVRACLGALAAWTARRRGAARRDPGHPLGRVGDERWSRRVVRHGCLRSGRGRSRCVLLPERRPNGSAEINN